MTRALFSDGLSILRSESHEHVPVGRGRRERPYQPADQPYRTPDESEGNRPLSTPESNRPRPLTAWVTGTLTMQFAGASVTRRLTLADAQGVRQMIADQRESDYLDWHCADWLQFDSPKVLFSDFSPDEDLGWRLTPDERAILIKHGYAHGFLQILLDLWKTKGREPSYSPLAMSFLLEMALQGSCGDEFTLLAEGTEGDTGANLVRAAFDQTAANPHHPRDTTGIVPDDLAEPDEAPPETEAGADAEDPAYDDQAGPETETTRGTSRTLPDPSIPEADGAEATGPGLRPDDR